MTRVEVEEEFSSSSRSDVWKVDPSAALLQHVDRQHRLKDGRAGSQGVIVAALLLTFAIAEYQDDTTTVQIHKGRLLQVFPGLKVGSCGAGSGQLILDTTWSSIVQLSNCDADLYN